MTLADRLEPQLAQQRRRRTTQTLLLLNTLLDVLPAPTTWTGNLVQRNTLPGPSPSRWKQCSGCDGAGTIQDRFKRSSVCAQCAGRGRYRIDDYTGQHVATTESTPLRTTPTVRCDRCNGDGVWKFRRCELCDGTGRRTAATHGLAITHETTSEPRPAELWGRNGSYHELERGLHQLDTFAPRGRRQVWHVHVDGTMPFADADHPLLELAVAYIVSVMPTPILVPAGVAGASKRNRDRQLRISGRHTDPKARAARDQEIRKLHRQGKPVQWIAQHTGLSVSKVYAIVATRNQETA